MSTEFVIITLLLIIECTLIGALWLVFGKIDELKTYIYKKELKALLEKEHPDVTLKIEPVETVETNAGPIEVKREDVTFDIPTEEVKPKPKRTSRKKKSDLDLAERKEAEETT